MRDQLEEIKNKTDIVEVIGHHVALKHVGRNFKGLCPFHSEKTPSFVVSPDRQIWHCFGACGEGGDAFKFLMKLDNITFIEAARELAKAAGVTLKDLSFDDKLGATRERFFALNQLAAEYFNYVLFKSPVGKKALEYLGGRKIDPRLAQKFNLGYAPSSWDSLSKFLLKKKFTPQELFEVGLTVAGRGGGHYDRFRGRIMFPIADPRGNVCGFSGRLLSAADEAKYVNSPESLIYHKRESLYGINLAIPQVRKLENILLVEGEFDVISSHSIGIEHVAAIKGTAVTEGQLRLVKRYCPRLTLLLDADTAGEEAATRAIEEAERVDLEVSVVALTGAKDPDEAVHADPIAFKKVIKSPTPAYDFLIDLYRKRFPQNDPYSKKRIASAVIPFVSRIANPIVSSHYIKKIAALLEVTEGSVRELMLQHKRKGTKKRYESSPQAPHDEKREEMLPKYLLSLLFQTAQSKESGDEVFKIVSPEDFFVPSLKNIAKKYLEYIKEHSEEFAPRNFAATLDGALLPAFDEVYLFASAERGIEEQNIRKLALEVRKQALKKKITDLLSGEIALSKEEEEKAQDLSHQLKEVEKSLVMS